MVTSRGSLALGFALSRHCRGAVTPHLLVVELQVFQALRQGQFLLDGHAQQRVQGLLLVLGCRQLPLHVVQLRHVLVTPEAEEKKKRKKTDKGAQREEVHISSSRWSTVTAAES